MAASYDPTLPTIRDRIRHTLADTNMTTPLRQDEEYEAVIGLHTEWKLAAADMAESLANQFAQEVDTFGESGGVSVSWKERVGAWQATARRLRAEVALAEQGANEGVPGLLGSSAPIRADRLAHTEYRRRTAGWGYDPK